MSVSASLEESVRRALGFNFRTYSGFEIISTWNSHHAAFYHFVLRKGGKKKEHMVAKCYAPVGEGHEPVYSLSHDPNVLFPREMRNLSIVNEVVRNPFKSPRHLVPQVKGHSDRDFTIVMNYVQGDTQRDRILRAAAESGTKLDEIFLKGVHLIARFAGLCNAYGNELLRRFDYHRDVEFLEKSSHGQLKENMARLFYLNNPELALTLGNYDYSKVFAHLLTQRGLNLDARVDEIQALKQELGTKTRFQHNDCNGLNIVGSTILDLESFGLGVATNDISSYCTIVGLGNTTMFRREQFNLYRHAYLAMEHAWEQLDPDLIRRVESYRNGELRKFVGELMSKEEYADWTLSFFAQAIEKNIQLGATYNRYSTQERMASGDTGKLLDQGRIGGYIKELLLIVNGLSPLINECSNPGGVRDYFYVLGKTMQDLGYNVDEQLLAGIKNRGVAHTILGEVPENFRTG